MALEWYRERKLSQAIRRIEASNINQVTFLEHDGSISTEFLSDEELAERGYHADAPSDVYIRNNANPVAELDADFELNHAEDPTEPAEVRLDGFIPSTEWKNFRDQKAAQEVFHRKESREIPWRVMIGLLLVGAAIFVITQSGLI